MKMRKKEICGGGGGGGGGVQGDLGQGVGLGGQGGCEYSLNFL